MSQKRKNGYNEFKTVHLNLTDEEFVFLINEMVFHGKHVVAASIHKKCKSALKFFRVRNHAIKQRKEALQKNSAKA
jgi:hypothetical protein